MNNSTTKKLFLAAMLTAVSGVLMAMEFSVPMMPAFYKIDFSDVPSILAVFMMGPGWAAAIETAKLVIKVMISGTNTMFVGEFANLISIAFFVLPIWFVYKKLGKTRKGAFWALLSSAVLRTLAACFINAYITLPMYARAMNISIDLLVQAVSAVNPSITNLRTFIIFATIPFNLIKIGLNSCIGYFIYDRLLAAGIVKKMCMEKAGVQA